jgi:outer membrane protein assembly factor BamA
LGVETGVNRYLGANWGLNLSNRFRQLFFSYSDTTILDTIIRRGITNSLIFNITYDSRDNFFNPNQGLYVSPLAEAAGGLLLGNNDFYRYSIELRAFQGVFGVLVFAGRAFWGAVLPYGRNLTIPYYEKYFVGGRNSLRGYDEYAIGPDSIGNQHYGDFLINTNFEIRTGYYKNFGLVLFWDGGEIENHINNLKLNRYQYSVGIGLRFNTPVGPIRLDYGKRLKNPPLHDRGKLYIGLLHAF